MQNTCVLVMTRHFTGFVNARQVQLVPTKLSALDMPRIEKRCFDFSLGPFELPETWNAARPFVSVACGLVEQVVGV